VIANLESYPAYKDSSADWLDEIPKEWDVLLARRFCRVFAGATPSRDEPSFWNGGRVPWLASGDVNRRRISTASQFITDAGFRASSTKWIRPGSVVIALAGQGKTKGMAALVDFHATCNQSLGVLEPSLSLCNPEFLLYYFESRYRDIRGLVGDLRDGLNLEHLKQLPVPIPPIAEQLMIVSVLNYIDSRIHRLIEAKERLVQLLEEEKRTIIHHAVTRGLDRDAVFTPSSITWLEAVPGHWRRSRLKGIAWMKAGRTITSDSIKEKGEYPVFGGNGLRGFASDFTHEGDRILIGRQGALCGNVHLVGGQFWATEHAIVVEVRNQCNIRWMSLLLVAMDLNQYSEAAAQPGLSTDRIRNLEVPVPPLAEQEGIAEWVDRSTAGADEVQKKALRQISLLREYRTRLISDVVTGKLDVREAAANLPDDPDADDSALSERLEEVAAG